MKFPECCFNCWIPSRAHKFSIGIIFQVRSDLYQIDLSQLVQIWICPTQPLNCIMCLWVCEYVSNAFMLPLCSNCGGYSYLESDYLLWHYRIVLIREVISCYSSLCRTLCQNPLSILCRWRWCLMLYHLLKEGMLDCFVLFSQIDIVCMQCLRTFGEWLGAT